MRWDWTSRRYGGLLGISWGTSSTDTDRRTWFVVVGLGFGQLVVREVAS